MIPCVVPLLGCYVCVCTCVLSLVRLCNPMDSSLPGSSVHGIFQVGWVAISFSRGSSWPRDWTRVSCVSCLGRQILYSCATWEAPTLAYISKKSENTNSKRCICSGVYNSIIYSSQYMEAMQVFTNKWIKKMCTHTHCLLSHTHSGILLSIVKNEILPFSVLWVDLKSIKLSEGTHRDKCYILSLICGIFLKKLVNIYNKI